MGKRILITCTDSMMKQFLEPHVINLYENGYKVDVICSEVLNRMEEVRNDITEYVNSLETVDLVRSPLSPRNLKGLSELKKKITSEKYDIIWTNEPVMGVMTRLAAKTARNTGVKVLYMVHGFHFYKGAPILNWFACPIEKYMSRYNDALVTINWEDYNWARKHLKVKQVFHIDGIGVDFERKIATKSRKEMRKELGLNDEDIMLLSVGELQKRKNHEPMIRAIARLNERRIKYYICGIGYLDDHLRSLTRELGLDSNVFFLGYRKDIANIMVAADIFGHPSLREGLGIAPLEAMAFGLPLVTSNIQGIPDYVQDGVTGFMCSPMDIEGYAANLRNLINDTRMRKKIGSYNKHFVEKYGISNSKKEVLEVIESILE